MIVSCYDDYGVYVPTEIPDGVNWRPARTANVDPVGDPSDGNAWLWRGKTQGWVDLPRPVRYKTKGLTPTQFRDLYGQYAFDADRAGQNIDTPGGLDFLQGRGIVSVDDLVPPTFNLREGTTFRDVLRTTTAGFNAAPIIDTDNPATVLGVKVHYMIGVLPSQDVVDQILRGMPI